MNNVCAFCANTGAEWLLTVGTDTYRVHKLCGNRLAVHAPEGTTPKIVPSQELRRKWQAERRTREAQAFWAEKFKAAQAARVRPG